MDTLMPSILFSAPCPHPLTVVYEPLSGVLSKSTQSLMISGGVGRWAIQCHEWLILSSLEDYFWISLPSLGGIRVTNLWQWGSSLQVHVCVCVFVCVCVCVCTCTLKRLLPGRLRYGHSLPGTFSFSYYGKNWGFWIFFDMHKCLFVTANSCNPHIFINGFFFYPEHVQYVPNILHQKLIGYMIDELSWDAGKSEIQAVPGPKAPG